MPLAAPAQGASSGTHFKPGRWVEVHAEPPAVLEAPGTATVVEQHHAEAQYVLPMSAAWPTPGTAGQKAIALPEKAWLVARLGTEPGAAREGLLEALPEGSAVVPLGDVRRGVPESVDLVVCYDFSESRLQPRERLALQVFAERGGAVVLVYASRAIPAASLELWRELFGAQGPAEKQVAGLPRGLLVPSDFRLSFDEELPRLVWRRSGRGITLAYGLAPTDPTLNARESAAALFERAVLHVRQRRRPVTLGPFDPEVYGLFDAPEWSAVARGRLTLLIVGYAGAAAGLLVSFGGRLARRRWAWLVGVLCVAAAGAALVAALSKNSGLALEERAFLIIEPDAAPVQVTVGRVTRLGPGEAPKLRTAARTRPKLVLYDRFAAAQKTWVRYRFHPDQSTVEPTLDAGQSICLVSVEPVFPGLRSESPGGGAAPPNADKVIAFFEERWAKSGAEYTYAWPSPFRPSSLFPRAGPAEFVQVRTHPVLVARRVPER